MVTATTITPSCRATKLNTAFLLLLPLLSVPSRLLSFRRRFIRLFRSNKSGMADLQTRIGPKVGKEHFRNKSWVRPGYEPTTPNQRSNWHHRKPSDGNGSELSEEHDYDALERGKPTLLIRLGLKESPETQEGMRDTTPTLLERINPSTALEADSTQGADVSVLGDGFVSVREGARRTPPKVSNADESFGSHMGLKAKPVEQRTTSPPNQPVTTQDKKTSASPNNRSLSSRISERESIVGNHLDTTHNVRPTGLSRQASSDKNPSPKDPPTQRSSNILPTPPPTSNPLRPTETSKSSIVTLGASSSITEEGELPMSPKIPPSQQSSLEDGELRAASLPPDKVRDLVLPLVLRIAADRITDAESSNVSPQSSSPVNTEALTDELLTSFAAKGTTEVRREMRAHDGESSSSAWRFPPASDAIPPITPSAPNPSRNVPDSSSQQTASGIYAASHPTPERGSLGHGPPPRIRESPRNSEAAVQIAQSPAAPYNNESSSSKLPDLHIVHRNKRPRSPTPPQRYARQRRSSPYGDVASTSKQPPYVPRSVNSYDYAYSLPSQDQPRRVSGPPPPRSAISYRPRSPTVPYVPAYQRTIFAEPMAARSLSPMDQRSSSREVRSPIRERGRTPPISLTSYAPRSAYERGDTYRRGRDHHRPSLDHRDPRFRRPSEERIDDRRHSRSPLRRSFEERTGKRRQSWSPPRRLMTSDQYISTESPLRSRTEIKLDYGEKSKSSSMEGHRVQAVSPERPQRQEMNTIQESPMSKAFLAHRKAAQSNALFWDAKRGLDHLGILKWTFELDDKAATRLNLNKINDISASTMDNSPEKPTKKTSLKLACYSKDLVIQCIEKGLPAGEPPTLETLSANHVWPTFGHLIVKVNEELPDFKGRTFLPKKLGPNSPPLALDLFLHKGQNIIELIQLSGMEDKVFWLREHDDVVSNNTHTEDHLPFANSLEMSKIIPIEPAIVTVTDLL